MYKRVDVVTFGGTFALKGAIEEQHASMPHCHDGCVYCMDVVGDIFSYWMREQNRYASAAHEHVRSVGYEELGL